MGNSNVFQLLNKTKRKWPYDLDRIKMQFHLLESQDWEKIDKYFIISTGRTGTKFFAKFLNQFGNVYATHEPSPDFLGLAIDYVRGEVSKKEVIKRIEQDRRALCKDIKRKQANVYVESNNRLFSLIDPLRDVFNDYKIIHIIRDGRDYVRSGMSREWYTKKDKYPRLKATYFSNDLYYDKWDTMSRFEKICWRWQKKDGFILDSIKDDPNSITVKFEDIFKDDDYKGIYQIAEYIGLPKSETDKMIDKMMNRKVNSTSKHIIDKWSSWSQDMVESFEEIAGEHMKKYYDYKW